MKSRAALIPLVLVSLVACSRDQVQSTRVDKAGAPGAGAPAPGAPEATALPPSHPPVPGMPAPGAPVPGAAMPGAGTMTGDVPPPPAPGTIPGLRWTLPKGWSSAPAGGMRYATLKPPVGGNVDVSVVVLSGEAGGELANVNRWRSQLGLPPVEEAGLAPLRKVVKAKVGPVNVFEFNNTGNRMVVGLLTTADGHTWFFKLLGEDASVTQAKPDFMKLLGTLTLG